MEEQNKKSSLITTIIQIASVWVISDIGYYIFLPALGFGNGYNYDPIAITVYYIFWTLIVILSFKDFLYKKRIIHNRKMAVWTLVGGTSAVILYLSYVMPILKAISWNSAIMPPVEILSATSWYFLPKSIEIFLQQILLLIMVMSFEENDYNIKTTSFWCAGLFGGGHLLLALGGGGFIYVSVFTIVAVVSSFIFPYLLLKVRNGFIYSYFLHWSFYATVIVLTRLIFKV